MADPHLADLRQGLISVRARLALKVGGGAGGIAKRLLRRALQIKFVFNARADGLTGSADRRIADAARDIRGMGLRIAVRIGGYGKSMPGRYGGVDGAVIGPTEFGAPYSGNVVCAEILAVPIRGHGSRGGHSRENGRSDGIVLDLRGKPRDIFGRGLRGSQ